MKTIIFKGKECKAERVSFYAKRGPYTHGWVKGWQLVDMDGNVVVHGDCGRPSSAYAYQSARYQTRARLMEDVSFQQEEWEHREARKRGEA